MPLEHLVGTDLRCNDRYRHCSEHFPEQRPVIALQPRLCNSFELEKQHVPGHLPLPQRIWRKRMWHRKNDKPANAIRVDSSRQPCHSGSPVVSNNVRRVDTKRVENAKYIRDRVLQGIRGYSFRAIGAPEATLIRRDGAEAIREKEWNLVAPKVRRVRPPMEQEHRLTAAVVFYMKGNAVSRNMMLRIPRHRWTCWNQQTFALKTSAERCFCEGSSGCQYAAKPCNERTTGIDGSLFTVIVHLPFSIKSKSDSFTIAPDCQRFPNTTGCLTGDPLQPQFLTFERPDVLHSLWTSHDVHMRIRRSGPHDVGASRLMPGWQSCSLRIERPHDHPVWPHGDCRTGFVIGV